MLEPREHDLLARLLDLAGEKDLVEDGVDLVEVEDEVELAHVAEEGVQDLDEEVDGLQIGQLVVVGVDARAEEEARVSPVHDLVVPELDEIRLVLLVAGRHEAVDLRRRGRVLVGVPRVRTRGMGSGKGRGIGFPGFLHACMQRKRGRRKLHSYLAFQLDLLVIGVWHIPLREPGLASARRTPVSGGLWFGRLPAANSTMLRVTHCRFCINMKDNIVSGGCCGWVNLHSLD